VMVDNMKYSSSSTNRENSW